MKTSNRKITAECLAKENQKYKGTGGVSEYNRAFGFVPAFYNMVTGEVYLSCFANGRPAPVHLLDGLPSHAVLKSVVTGKAYALQDAVISGFVLGKRFYTREEARLAFAA